MNLVLTPILILLGVLFACGIVFAFFREIRNAASPSPTRRTGERNRLHGDKRCFRVPYPNDEAVPLLLEVWKTGSNYLMFYRGTIRSRSTGANQSAEGWLPIPADFFLWQPQNRIERSLDALLSNAEDGQLITGAWNEEIREEFGVWLNRGVGFQMAASPKQPLSDACRVMSFSYRETEDTPRGEHYEFYPFSVYAGYTGRLFLNWVEEENAETSRCELAGRYDRSFELPGDFFDRDPDAIRQDLTRLVERVPHYTPNPRFAEDFPQIVERLRSLRAQE